jgi:YHS domain-containing protein
MSKSFFGMWWQARCKSEIAMRLALGLLAVVLSGCDQQPLRQPVEMDTLESVAVRSMPVENPPQIYEEATLLQPASEPTPSPSLPGRRSTPASSPKPGVAAPESVTQLPFAPAIAMDPVDGSKISIRVGTPTTEYKNRIYYFGSEENRRAFTADPENYLKGQLSRF